MPTTHLLLWLQTHQYNFVPFWCKVKASLDAIQLRLIPSCSKYKSHDWVWSKISFLVGPQEPLVATVNRDGNSRGLGMSHATRASPKPSFRAPWRVSEAVVGSVGWTTSDSDHPCLCQNCSQWPPAKKPGTGSQLNRPSWSPDEPIGQGTKLN